MANAVIVVDMQKGSMAPQGTLFCGAEARQIIPRIRARAEREKARGAALFFTQDSHAADDREFEMFPPHCVEGSAISGPPPIDFTADIKEIDGRPVARRARIPGLLHNPRLQPVDLSGPD